MGRERIRDMIGDRMRGYPTIPFKGSIKNLTLFLKVSMNHLTMSFKVTFKNPTFFIVFKVGIKNLTSFFKVGLNHQTSFSK